MSFDPSAKTAVLIERLSTFMEAHVYPNEARFEAEVAEGDRWKPTRIMEELKDKAKAAGAEQLNTSGAHQTRPMISQSGAYSRLVRPAPNSDSGRKRFHSPLTACMSSSDPSSSAIFI